MKKLRSVTNHKELQTFQDLDELEFFLSFGKFPDQGREPESVLQQRKPFRRGRLRGQLEQELQARVGLLSGV